MSQDTHEDPLQLVEAMLKELRDVVAKHDKLSADADRDVRAVQARYTKLIDPLTTRREHLVDEIAKLANLNREVLTDGSGKTATLRWGTISFHMAPKAIDLGDEDEVRKYLRKKGVLRRFTKQVARRIDKNALKGDPAFVADAPDDIMLIRQDENIIIKLAKTQIEIKRVLRPLTRQVPDST